MLASPVFWLLYVMFVLVSASGLMVAAQIALIAKDYGVAQTVILFGATTLIVAGIIDNLANGGARPFFGWVSDQIGREYTMAIAFTAGGVAYWLLGTAGTTPWTFVICAALIFFTWGEIFSLFPSTCTDMFGPKYATTNTSLLYTAKGLSAFVVPLANILKAYTGNWHAVFFVAAIMNFIVVVDGVVRGAADADLDQRIGKQGRGRTRPPGRVTGTQPGLHGDIKRSIFRRRQKAHPGAPLFLSRETPMRRYTRERFAALRCPQCRPPKTILNRSEGQYYCLFLSFGQVHIRFTIKLTIGIMYTNLIGHEDTLGLT